MCSYLRIVIYKPSGYPPCKRPISHCPRRRLHEPRSGTSWTPAYLDDWAVRGRFRRRSKVGPPGRAPSSIVPFENIDIVAILTGRSCSIRRGSTKRSLGNGEAGSVTSSTGCSRACSRSSGSHTRGYGRWPIPGDRWTVPFEHMVLAVTAPGTGERVLVDVGFGADWPVVAIPLRNDWTGTSIIPRSARIGPASSPSSRKHGESRRSGATRIGRWSMRLTLTPRKIDDFAERCGHLQTSPDSHFTQSLICSRPMKNGRVTLGGGSSL